MFWILFQYDKEAPDTRIVVISSAYQSLEEAFQSKRLRVAPVKKLLGNRVAETEDRALAEKVRDYYAQFVNPDTSDLTLRGRVWIEEV